MHPGTALFGDAGAAARIAVWRLRHAPIAAEPLILAGTDYIAIAELRGPQSPGGVEAFGEAARHVDLLNVYVPYTRRLAGAFPKGG